MTQAGTTRLSVPSAILQLSVIAGDSMNPIVEIRPSLQVRHESLRIGGERIRRAELIEVLNPYNGELVGTVPKATLADVQHAFAWAHGYRAQLTRYERSQILRRAAEIVRERTAEISDLITAESGLCKKDSLYEAGRVSDVMTFGANEAL
ncbi:acyl-CoA reductase-like NAD-dependent aldehyde dehydrogenase [Paraburkholderia sp. GAS448]